MNAVVADNGTWGDADERIVAALLFSRIWVPQGNNGRARVSAFLPMPLSEEMRRLLE